MNWSEWQASLPELIADPAQSAASAETGLSAAGLAVYRNNYVVGLSETLAFIYPVCRMIVGEEFFTGLAREYVKTHASQSGNLHLYGADMASFIVGFEHTRSLPYLADVAQLEWAVHRSYYAADTATLDTSALLAIPQESWVDLHFVAKPCVALIAASSPVVSIWLAHQPGGDVSGVLTLPAEHALLYRVAGNVQAEVITAATHALFAALFANVKLEEALERALTLDPAFDLQAALLTLFGKPLLAGLHL